MPSLAQKRNSAQKSLREVMGDQKRVLLVHYACEDFANRPDGSSARITAIAARHLDSAQTFSFSIHLSAERLGISYKDIADRYEELERDLLQDFTKFCEKHMSFTWVHWSMRDSNYGFPALYHRCKLLGIAPTEIPPTNLFDLARCLVSVYGSEYIEHPRLPKILEKNGISMLAYVDGSSEAQMSQDGEFVTIHRSTLRKVDSFEALLLKAHAGTLKTNYRWLDIYGNSLQDVVFYVREHWIYGLILIIMLGVGIAKLFT